MGWWWAWRGGWPRCQGCSTFVYVGPVIPAGGQLVARAGGSAMRVISWGLIANEGVGVAARRSPDGGRGLPKMEVLTPPIWKTSTWLTLPLMRASAALI